MIEILGPIQTDQNPIRKQVVNAASCGFPSPALEYAEPPLSIDELVSLRLPSRWLVRACGESMKDIGIYDKDVLVVDRALDPIDTDIVVVCLGADFVCKEFRERPGSSPLLVSHNVLNAPIAVGEWEEIDLFGVVLWNLHRVSR